MDRKVKVSIATLGCKSNQYDSAAIEDVLKDNKFSIVKSSEPADVCIINTCTVTGKTDYQSRQLIRKAIRAKPDAIVVVTGCYAQVSPQEVAQIEGVDYIVGNPGKDRMLQYILDGKRANPKIDVIETAKDKPLALRAKGSSGRARANLKVQDGCDNSCSYCIIPRARGVSRSLPISAILQEIEGLIANGYKEVILTGIHLGAYGLDLNPRGGRRDARPANIASLVKAIDNRNYPCRFRISSLDPDEISDELIEIMAGSKAICNHLHLPLQSGDDNILQAMNRRYTGRLFIERVDKIVSSIPEVSIGIDVIVGFPGEGEKEFLNTYNLLERLPIAYMHIFPFSNRKGTAAAGFSNQVDVRVVKERCERFRLLDKIKRKKFYENFIGKKM
ncbi:MAG: tRNA (N(6)-L-threonylcarbamoyladenosine(37)-C(2))-methylthiotransferase MtaB [Deltaproteobacteria bacterium]|nr:tRNA (N(6)-L-threonylcarbamoyladenosine(37)-C(2))-methylthiotransferase MtaB [Deltaproteobacteria bacterium]